jgi:hypothetical protein
MRSVCVIRTKRRVRQRAVLPRGELATGIAQQGAATRAAPAFIVEALLRLRLEHARQRVAHLVHHRVHHGRALAHQDGGEDGPTSTGIRPVSGFTVSGFRFMRPTRAGTRPVSGFTVSGFRFIHPNRHDQADGAVPRSAGSWNRCR